MGSLRVVLAVILLLAGLASATDYGTVSALDFSLVPGESATQSQEVSRCREEGCTDTLRLSVTVPADFSAVASPPEIKVDKAKVGQAFSASVTVGAKASASPGRYEGALQITSGGGDTWRYKLNITVRQASAAAPAPVRTSAGSSGGSTGGAVGTAAAAARGGFDLTLPLVGGGVIVAVVLLLVLQRRGLLPRGIPRPPPLSRGRGTGDPSPFLTEGSPVSAILRPLGAVGAAVAGRLKGLAARATRARAPMEDARLEQEWEQFVHQKLPGEAEAALAEEPPMEEVPAEEPPMVGDAPPAETLPPEEEPPAPVPEPGEPGPPEPPAMMAEPGPEPVEAEPEARISDEALLALRRDMDRLRSGMGTLADLRTMMERSLDDLRSLREEVDRVKSAPRPAATPAAPVPVMLPPDALKKLQAGINQEMMAAMEVQMAANTEKLGTWLREALKAVTLMKAQTPQAGGPPGTTGLQPLFDGLWKEVGSLRSAIQRLDTETQGSLQELVRQRAPGENLVKEAAALQFALEKQQAELAVLAKEVQALRAERAKAAPESGVALQADLDTLRTILRDIQRQMEGVEARLKNQELTFARGDEVRNLFRDLSALREDLAEVRMVMEEGSRMESAPVATIAARGPMVERTAVEVEPPARREGPDIGEVRREIEKQEAFLNSLEEYHRSGLMPERLYMEKKAQGEEKLRELKRKLRG